MSVMSEIKRIEDNIAETYTELESKGATLPALQNSDNLSATVIEVPTGGTTYDKGLVIKEMDSDGYPTVVELKNMTEIPNYYFAGYSDAAKSGFSSSIEKIEGLENITTIGEKGLFRCVSLKSLDLSNIENIGDSAFSYVGYRNSTTYVMPETHLNDNITTLPTEVFYNCISLNLTELPAGITSIGNYAFNSCSKLALTELPSGLTSIGYSTFYGCSNLALTELPSGLTSISNYAFRYCTNLAITELPAGITSIGNSAFQSCANLAITELPSGLTSISYGVFYGCTNIKSIKTYSGLTSIDGYVFFNCSNLSTFIITREDALVTLGSHVFSNTPITWGTGYIYVPDALVDRYKAATNWATYADQIKGLSELPTEEE